MLIISMATGCFGVPPATCRSTAQDQRGLLAAGVAGAPTLHRHGDQPAGGEQDQVPAVLARVREQEIWALSNHHH